MTPGPSCPAFRGRDATFLVRFLLALVGLDRLAEE